jgi:AcrR family transcriptional regulator
LRSPSFPSGKPQSFGAKERLDEAAYELFSKKGTRAVGIDEVIKHSGVARMTLYRHYNSKEDLILAFLELREKRWTFDWLVEEATRRAAAPQARLLVIFDLFDEWFHEKDFRGCPLINVMVESEFGGPTHRAAARKLANINTVLKSWAAKANLADPEDFARMWQILIKGSIISALASHLKAASKAKYAAALILKDWPRKTSSKRKTD